MNQELRPDAPVRYVKQVGPERAKYLESLDIETAGDLLFHLPNRYIHRQKVKRISQIPSEMNSSVELVVEGEITWLQSRTIKGGRSLVEIRVRDESGNVKVVWFNMDFLTDKLERGERIQIAGTPEMNDGVIEFTHPDYRYPAPGNGGEEEYLVPVYPLTEGISQSLMRSIIQNALDALILKLTPVIPEELRERRDLPPLAKAVQMVHRPSSETEAERGRKTLVYQKALLYFLSLQRCKQDLSLEKTHYQIQVSAELDTRIRNRFPFELTDAQDQAVSEIWDDFRNDRVMYRLLQGDVGSGKTVVALWAILAVIANDYQCAIMAPTSVLARQHFQTIDQYLSDSKVNYELLMGATDTTEKQEKYERLDGGDIDLVIGTHALLEEPVEFNNLALVVVDEQQRFGVRHRTELVSKSNNPHVLVTTATPIPRSLTLTVYGDLDISILDEMPPGRKPVKTVVRPRSKLGPACDFIREKLEEGRQAFFVYPLVEESEELSLKSATEMYETLSTEHFPSFEVELLHGQMPTAEKEEVMNRFRNGEAQILVSTVVIEVGVDVPNATIMVIDHAERYGLSQLHQLRGRIGRGEHRSYCILLADDPGETARKRLDVLRDTDDGFEIAEEDLKMRGPGTLLGTRQHGMPELDLLNLTNNTRLLQLCRKDAEDLYQKDPELNNNPELKQRMEEKFPDPDQFLRSG